MTFELKFETARYGFLCYRERVEQIRYDTSRRAFHEPIDARTAHG